MADFKMGSMVWDGGHAGKLLTIDDDGSCVVTWLDGCANVAMLNDLMPWSPAFSTLTGLPYELNELICNDVSFKEMRRICLCATGATRRTVLADTHFPAWLIRTAQQRYGQIDVGSHANVQDLFDTLISLENAVGGITTPPPEGRTAIYPTSLPHSAKNIACLLPQIFGSEVCKKVCSELSDLDPVGRAIHHSTAQSGPPKRTTILRFSKASFTPGSNEVTVDMGVFTANGWTEVASIVNKRGKTSFAKLRLQNSKVMDHLHAEFNDGDVGGTFFARSMRDVLDRTKRWAAPIQELSWLQNMCDMHGDVMPQQPVPPPLASATHLRTRLCELPSQDVRRFNHAAVTRHHFEKAFDSGFVARGKEIFRVDQGPTRHVRTASEIA